MTASGMHFVLIVWSALQMLCSAVLGNSYSKHFVLIVWSALQMLCSALLGSSYSLTFARVTACVSHVYLLLINTDELFHAVGIL